MANPDPIVISTMDNWAWAPYKHLYATIQKCVVECDGNAILLQVTLQKYKQNFLNVLRNPVKNSKSRAIVKRSEVEKSVVGGVNFHGLPKDIIDDAIIMSDMLNLDELTALDLIITGQKMMPSYPGLERGLVAVLLYYDGHKALASSLQAIVQARSGFQWNVNISNDAITDFMAKFSDDLVAEGLFEKILGVLSTFEVEKELEALKMNRALNGPKHERTVVLLIEEIRQILADILFLYAAQAGLRKQPLFALLNHVSNMQWNRSPLSNVDLTLQMALLFAVDVSEVSKLTNGEELLLKYPLVSEEGLAQQLVRELLKNADDNKSWCCFGFKAIVQLSVGLFMETFKKFDKPMPHFAKRLLDEGDALIDAALKEDVFAVLRDAFLGNEMCRTDEFYARRMHNLLADFVALKPTKVMELRQAALECDRMGQMYARQGLRPPPSAQFSHFQALLAAGTRLYSGEYGKKMWKLHLDYWYVESNVGGGKSFASNRATPRKKTQQLSLLRFLSETGLCASSSPALFSIFLNWIASLAACEESARCAFNTFKSGEFPNLNWDRFFDCFHVYFDHLNCEHPANVPSNIHRPKAVYFNKNIDPLEVDRLRSVLALIRRISEYSDSSRLAFCENPNWRCISTFVGMVGCCVDIGLKTDLLLTLSALAKSEETASTVWRNLEEAQIVQTVRSTSNFQNLGIQRELEEIESRNEEFPLTKAMLTLLNALLEFPVPRMLGAGLRVAGFDPYFDYVIHDIWLRLNARSYKSLEEKWDIGDLCASLALKILKQYEPRTQDFSCLQSTVNQYDGNRVPFTAHPGFTLMTNLCGNSEFFKMVMFALDEGCRALESYKSFNGKEEFERYLLCCLRLVDVGLSKQSAFMQAFAASIADTMVVPFHQVLMGINTRTGDPDHLITIAKYVIFNSWLPKHAKCAVSILLSATAHPIKQSTLLAFIAANPDLRISLRHGFVECLEAEEGGKWCAERDASLSQGEGGDEDVLETKEVVMQLLLQCLRAPAPNLSHYLLGFDLKQPTKTILQMPGYGSPHTCFHSVLMLLQNSLKGRQSRTALKADAKMTLYAYKVLHALCYDATTSDSTLRYLRQQDFIQQHAQALPFTAYDKVSEFNCMAWLLKIFAVQLRVTSCANQVGKLESCARILLSTSGSNYQSECSNNYGTDDLSGTLLFRLFGLVNFSEEVPVEPNWQIIKGPKARTTLAHCQYETADFVKQIDLHKLTELLEGELAMMRIRHTHLHIQSVQQEVRNLVAYAEALNAFYASIGCVTHFFDAWHQLSTVFFHVAPPAMLPARMKQRTISRLLIQVLDMVSGRWARFEECDRIASEMVLSCLAMWRHLAKVEHRTVAKMSQNDGAVSRAIPWKVFQKMRAWIGKSSAAASALKVNLYASFLTILHVEYDVDDPEIKFWKWLREMERQQHQQGQELANGHSGDRVEEGGSCSDMEIESEKKCKRNCLDEQLLRVFCDDAIVATNIWKMLAMSNVQKILDVRPDYLTFLRNRGYLKCLAKNVVDSDGMLSQVLDDGRRLGPLYVYEGVMSLFLKVANYPEGAENIANEGIISSLAAMEVFMNHPVIDSSYDPRVQHATDFFVPDRTTRFTQLYVPYLKLCYSVMLMGGLKNKSVHEEILQMLIEQGDTIGLIFRSCHPHIEPVFLYELSYAVKIMTMWLAKPSKVEDKMDRSTRRMQQLLLGMMKKFSLAPVTLKKVQDNVDPTEENALERSRICVEYLQIVANLLSFARDLVGADDEEGECVGTNFLFQPTLMEWKKCVMDDMCIVDNEKGRVFDLGFIVKYIVEGVCLFHKTRQNLEHMVTQLTLFSHMTLDETKQAVRKSDKSYTAGSKNEAALRFLKLLIEDQRKVETLSVIVEHALYLLWAHLDHFELQNAGAKSLSTTMTEPNLGQTVSLEQLNQLKRDLVTIFNDKFSVELVSMTKENSALSNGYIEALLRRIKKFVQFAHKV